MLVIRLSRFGKKKHPFYRIVVADSHSAISGKYIEKIGHYNPLTTPPVIFVDKEKAKKWLSQGAKPSDTVWNLLVEAGILKKKIVTKRAKKKKEKPASAEATVGKKEIEKPLKIEEIKEVSEAKSAEASGEGGKETEKKEAKEEKVASSKEGPPRLAPGETGRSASERD